MRSSTASSSDLRPQGCTNLKLRQLTRRIGRLYDEEMAKAGLKITQYSLLSHVVRMGPVRSVDLAAAMHMEASTLSRNLRPLIAEGWVQLHSGADARTHAVVATPAGLAKRAEAQRRWRAAQETVNDLLGAPQVMALHGLIDSALQRLDTQAEPEPEPEEHP